MRRLCRVSLFFLLLSLSAFHAFAQFQQPTPAELSMTSDPAAPGADVVYLYREEVTDDTLHSHSIYVRLKILTEKGKEYADVELPDEYKFSSVESDNHVRDLSGRTIHPDGSIVPFTGKPFEHGMVKGQGFKVTSKIFTMPDVQVGSILEYRFTIQYDDQRVSAPHWIIQREAYVHRAHYSFIPWKNLGEVESEGGGAGGLAYIYVLPKGVTVSNRINGQFTLDINDVPPQVAEEYLPPLGSVSYRVLFYYTGYHNTDDFWKGEGKGWSKKMDGFASPSKNLKEATQALVSGATGPDEQLKAIYAAVMKMDNTDFNREHTAQEDKSEGIKEAHNAESIFNQERGTSDELALLFVAMARAAGFKAYAMQVPNRDRDLFQPTYLSLGQLDDVIAVVEVGGKEMFFDPGARYCSYGTLHWKHTLATGLRQTDGGTEIASTPAPSFKENATVHVVDLNLDASGKVQGIARILLTGAFALKWRQEALRSDQAEVTKDFEAALQKEVPPGIDAKVQSFVGLDNPDQQLMAVVAISGSMGTATSKRLFLPAFFFQANQKPIFAQAKREGPVDLRYPYVTRDTITIHLPPGTKVEATPQDQAFPLEQFAEYVSKAKSDGNSITLQRTVALGNPLYKVDEYPELKGFFDKINTADQQQIILDRAAGSGGQ